MLGVYVCVEWSGGGGGSSTEKLAYTTDGTRCSEYALFDVVLMMLVARNACVGGSLPTDVV